MDDAARELAWLRRARELSHRLADEPEPATLLPLILDGAIELAGAERGFLVRVQPGEGRGKLRVEVARGFDGEAISGGASAVSRRVVEEVLKKGDQGVVTTREEDRDLLAATTVRDRRVLAILCVPMRLRGRTAGVIYLDHRFKPDAFRATDVEPLRLFADQAALAIEGAELRAERERALEQLELAKGQLRAHESAEARKRRLGAQQQARRESGAGGGLGALVGDSPAAHALFAAVERAARSRDPVLIVGETGSGKSAVAVELHRLSEQAGPERAQEVSTSLHCARTSPRELEAAFAAGGTLVLEEVGDASPALQAALSALLHDERTNQHATRLLATTRADLAARARDGAFREDLLYRLDVLRVDVPPLRARREDVPLLLDHVSERRLELTPGALQALVDHAWPGNLHELQNLVRRLLALGKKVTTADLPEEVQRGAAAPAEEEATIAGMERKMVVAALEACGGNKALAARRLGIQRSTLYRLLERYGLR